MENILVTGGCGFIGINFIQYVLTYSQYRIINMDCLSYAANDQSDLNFPEDRYTFIYGNIVDKEAVTCIIKKYDIKKIIHFAAESHVDRSIQDASIFVQSNVKGTQTLLDCAKNIWKENEGIFIHISTDEVFGTLKLNSTDFFKEDSAYNPNSPYAATKAASDLLVKSYIKTYDFPAIITHGANNYGAFQHKEKFIPTIIRSCIENKPIPIYGNGQYIREWINVLDHCEAIYTVLHIGDIGQSYNIGSDDVWLNIDLAVFICTQMDDIVEKSSTYIKKQELITYTKDRLGHDVRYTMDSNKIRTELNWHPKYSIKETIKNIIYWYIHDYYSK